MAELLLVRHAQAGKLSGHYDQVSELGTRQARHLGRYFAEQGLAFDRVVRGSLDRHAGTLDPLLEELGGSPDVEVLPGLDEYDFHDIAKAYFLDHERPDDFWQDRRAFFRILRLALLAWSRDELPLDHLKESWGSFARRVSEALAALTDPAAGQRVLAVSSGGAISMVLAEVLGLAPEVAIRLNLQTKNTGFSRFIFTGRDIYLHSFNGAPHLETPERQALVTYS